MANVIDVTVEVLNDRNIRVSFVTAQTKKKTDTLITSDVST